MSNYNFVSANFCISKPISIESYSQLFNDLHRLKCTYNQSERGSISGYQFPTDTSIDHTETRLNNGFDHTKIRQIAEFLATPGYVSVNLQCQLDSTIYNSRIFQIAHPEKTCFKIIFDIEESAFFDKEIELTDWNNNTIERYEEIIAALVKNVRPHLGIIDYEADLECTPNHELSSLSNWGLYLSHDIMSSWDSDNITSLIDNVDRYVEIETQGLLVFLYPLRVNQAWTKKHESLKLFLSNVTGQ